jgi:hypothetical protein
MNSALTIEDLHIKGKLVHGSLGVYVAPPCTLQELWLAVVQKPEAGGRAYWGTQKLALSYVSSEDCQWYFPFSFVMQAPEQQLPLGELRLSLEEQEERKEARNTMAMAAGPFFFEAMLLTDVEERVMLSEKIDLNTDLL